MSRHIAEDVRTWASSIGANTIDIADRRCPKQSQRPLRAPLVSGADLERLRDLAGRLPKKTP